MNGRCLFLVTLINYKSNLVLLNSKKKIKFLISLHGDL